jgi:hypothetical protein
MRASQSNPQHLSLMTLQDVMIEFDHYSVTCSWYGLVAPMGFLFVTLLPRER